MNDALTWSQLLTNVATGFIIPLFVGFVTRPNTPSWIKGGLLLFLSVLLGVVATAVTTTGTTLDWDNLPAMVFTIAVSAQVWYNTMLRELSKKLQETGPIK
jgi:hypothetical protein